jgi:hypothetical protein
LPEEESYVSFKCTLVSVQLKPLVHDSNEKSGRGDYYAPR